MSFQWIANKAAAIALERKQVTASTQSRSGIVRTVSRGPAPWRIEITLPDGLPWSEVRNDLAKSETLDKFTSSYIQLNNYSLLAYQGDAANPNLYRATITKGSATVTLTTSPSTPSGYKFKAGDLVQLGLSGHVYAVIEDVPYNSNSVTFHRPVLEESASNVAFYVGQSARFNVICRDFPSWTIGAGNIVTWSGPFVFNEVI